MKNTDKVIWSYTYSSWDRQADHGEIGDRWECAVVRQTLHAFHSYSLTRHEVEVMSSQDHNISGPVGQTVRTSLRNNRWSNPCLTWRSSGVAPAPSAGQRGRRYSNACRGSAGWRAMARSLGTPHLCSPPWTCHPQWTPPGQSHWAAGRDPSWTVHTGLKP